MNINDFLNFCDQMEIAEEKLDTVVLDGFGDPYITLYHASPLKLTVINPTSWNIGNRLSPKTRKSSFWTNNMNYSILWALDWVAMRISGMPFVHDLRNYKFYVSKECYIEIHKGKTKIIMEAKRWMLSSLKKQPVYVYEAKIPRKIVSKGQFNIDEYTVDIPVKPSNCYVITQKEASDVIIELEKDVFDRINYSKIGDTRKENPNLRERLIFKNPDLVIKKRTELYDME